MSHLHATDGDKNDKSARDPRDDSIERALNLLSRDGLDGASKMVEMALEENPESSDAWAARADIMYFKGENAEALRCCDRSLMIDPGNARAWNTRGNALYSLGRYDEAERCYSTAIKAEPLMVRAWRNKKMALDMQMKMEKSKPRISGAFSTAEKRR
jgi:Tfp pilus assembly protein PilF